MTDINEQLARRYGKSQMMKILMDEALEAGKRVLVVDSAGMTMHRKVKHLVVIEPFRRTGTDRGE